MGEQEERKNSELDVIRKKSWNEAFLNYGTAYVFRHWTTKYRRRRMLLSFAAAVGPLLVGALYLAFRSQQMILDIVIACVSLLGVVQLIISVWAAYAGWEDRYNYALEAAIANTRLSEKFKNLGEHPHNSLTKAKAEFDYLNIENELRSTQDEKQNVSEEDRRMGMRAALRQFRKPCSECNEIPKSMSPSNCNNCGNFQTKRGIVEWIDKLS